MAELCVIGWVPGNCRCGLSFTHFSTHQARASNRNHGIGVLDDSKLHTLDPELVWILVHLRFWFGPRRVGLEAAIFPHPEPLRCSSHDDFHECHYVYPLFVSITTLRQRCSGPDRRPHHGRGQGWLIYRVGHSLVDSCHFLDNTWNSLCDSRSRRSGGFRLLWCLPGLGVLSTL